MILLQLSQKLRKQWTNFLVKKPNEETNYKFEQKKTNSRSILEKNGSSETSLSHQLAEVEGKNFCKKLTKMKKFKKNIKHKTSKYQNKIAQLNLSPHDK